MRSPVDVLDLFCELAAIESPPGRERAVADRLAGTLAGLGLDVVEDDAAGRIGGDTGNLHVKLPATAPGTPILLCAHLDTVPPTGPLEPVVEGGIVRNAGGTILGADNKAAVAAMVVAVARLLAEGRSHAGVDLLLTPMEEIGSLGARAFDVSRLEARFGFVYDHEARIGEIVLAAPGMRKFDVLFTGQAAHAGMAPEEGRSAIQAAARAIADLRLGRLDEGTSANVGLISGGSALNVVPERCSFQAECRSLDESTLAALAQEMLDAFHFAAATTDCRVDVTMPEPYPGYRHREGDPLVQLAAHALERSGYAPIFGSSGGGSDANVFVAAGIPALNLANGMTAVHTPDERIAVADLEGMVTVTLGLLEAACDAA